MAGQTGAAMVQHTIRVTLRGKDNATYTGTLLVKNWTAVAPPDEVVEEPRAHQNDPTGASYYVIAVVLVYGFSIVMLIASHIKRKHAKLIEDRQINKYLEEFQIVSEKSSRDSYRNLKKSIVAKLHKERRPTYRTLSTTILPMMAIGLPTIQEQNDQQGNGQFLQIPGDHRARSESVSNVYDINRGRLSTIADSWRPRSASVSNQGDLRPGSVERMYPYRHHYRSGDCEDIEIDVPVLMSNKGAAVAGSWKVLKDSIPELDESHFIESSPSGQPNPAMIPRASSPQRSSPQRSSPQRSSSQRSSPQRSSPPQRSNSPPHELRPDRLEAILADQLLNNKSHRVQTHRPPSSPPGRVRRVGVAPLARVYVATSTRAQAHMRPISPRLHRPYTTSEDVPRTSGGGVSSVSGFLAPPGRMSSVSPPLRAGSPARDRLPSSGTSERSASPACSDCSADDQEENVWLLIDNETNGNVRNADSPQGAQYSAGFGSRGSASPLIKSSREGTPLNSREGSQSRDTTPSRMSTRSGSMARDSRGGSPMRVGPPYPKTSPHPSRSHTRQPNSETAGSPETEQLLQVTVL